MKTRILRVVLPCILAFFIVSFLPTLSAAQPEEEGLLVVAVRIEGNRIVSTQLIRAQLRVREGKTFSRSDVQRDVTQLFSLGYFSDIKADVSPENEGVAVTYIVTERKIIREVLLLGNKKIKEEDIRPSLTLRRGDTYTPKSIEKDIAVIREKYREKGYPSTAVSASYREISPTEVEVVYEITENSKARVRRVIIENNNVITDHEIHKVMRLRGRVMWFGSLFDEAAFKQDLKAIENLYANRGYIDVKITDTKIDISNEGKRVALIITVEEGQQYFVKSIAFEGNTVFDDDQLMPVTKTRASAFYNRGQTNEDAFEVQSFYSDQGYILANVAPRLAIDKDNREIGITYRVTERDLVYIAKVDVEGNIKTKDSVIRRELIIMPGERFDGGRIRRSRQRLLNTQYFKEVYVDTKPTDEPDYRDLVLEVEEEKTGSFNFGAGYSSNDALIGQIQITQNNFDLFNPPTFTGAGQKFSAVLRPGTVLSEYRLSLTEPYFLGYPFAAGFDMYYIDREYDEYEQQTFGSGVRIGKRITDYTSAGISYSWNTYEISGIDDDAPDIIKAEEGNRTKSSVELNLSNDTRDNYLDPTTGHRYGVALEVAGGPFGAETDIVKLVGEARWYKPLIGKTVLMSHLEAGVVEEYGDSDFVPLFDRFFAGGSSSVRGYDYRDVGPREDGDPIGGKTKIEGTLELSYPLATIIKVYSFFDAGQVWRSTGDFGQGKINTSVGVGIGLRTPVGPIRLDYGYPLNPDDDQGSGRIHFSTGISF